MKIVPFMLTIIAGLSTLIGFLVTYTQTNENKVIKYSLSFASGVMVCVSIYELIPESIKLLSKSLNKCELFLYLFFSILIGCIVPYIIDKKISRNSNDLYKLGILSMIAIIVHNIPEGIITYLSASKSLNLGITMTIAIAFHNVPEGISIAVPIYYANKSRGRAFLYTFLSGMSEPLGAIISHILLNKIINDTILGIILTITSAVMTTISINSLLSKALEYQEKIKTIIFFIIGIAMMIISIKIIK